MKQYSHDYTLVQHADNLLQEALVKIRWDNWWDARIRIEDARKKLQQYLSQDNMVPDDDVDGGWVKAGEAKDVIGALRSQVAHYQDTMQAMGKVSMEVVRISEERLQENEQLKEKVEKHKGIDSQYLKQNTDGADPTNPLYGKTVVESGTYEQIGMTRDEVAAAIQKLGAKLNRGVSKTMDVFVTGNRPGPSKMKQVLQWRSEGLQIEIIDQMRIKEIIDKYLPKD